METIEDIVREMRSWACMERNRIRQFADRLDAAYKRDMQTAMDEVTSLRAENERLKAALKSVLEYRQGVGVHPCDGYCALLARIDESVSKTQTT